MKKEHNHNEENPSITRTEREKSQRMAKNKKRIKNILMILLTLLIIGGIAINFINPETNKKSNEDIGDVDKDATEYVQKESEESAKKPTIDIPGYPHQIHLKSEQKELNIQFVNPKNNSVYFKFAIEITGKNSKSYEKPEVVYTSDLVEPGQVIETQELSKPLSEGTYNASIIIRTFSIDSEEEMNGARTKTQFLVE